MVALYKDPQGKNVFQRVAVTTQMRSSGTAGTNTNTTSCAAAKVTVSQGSSYPQGEGDSAGGKIETT